MISAHKHENGDIAITWLRGGMESTQKVQAMIDGLQAALKEAEAMKKGTFKESSAKESSAKASRPQTSAEKVARKILARDINDITKG